MIIEVCIVSRINYKQQRIRRSQFKKLSDKLHVPLTLFPEGHVGGLLEGDPFHLRDVLEERSDDFVRGLILPTVDDEGRYADLWEPVFDRPVLHDAIRTINNNTAMSLPSMLTERMQR